MDASRQKKKKIYPQMVIESVVYTICNSKLMEVQLNSIRFQFLFPSIYGVNDLL